MIKKILLVSLIFGTSLVYSQFQRPISEILKKDGYYYLLEDYLLYGDKTTKFNGKVYELIPNPYDSSLDSNNDKRMMEKDGHRIQIRKEFNVLNGLLHGSYNFYDDKGKLEKQYTYQFGKLDGPFREYCDEFYSGRNNVIRTSVNFKDGKKEGLYNSNYCSTNSKSEMGTYLNGKKEGKWIEYSKDGKITRIKLFENGLYIVDLEIP